MRTFLLSISLALIANLFRLGGKPEVLEQSGSYTRVALTDSTSLEIFEGDSIIVVMTACAPQCSSRARVYNKEWTLFRNIKPTVTSIFPLASIDKESGQLTWSDNDNWEYQGK